MTKIENMKEKILKLNNTGFFSIFISTILSKVITLLGGIVLVRFLSKSDYGIYSYIHNCYSMLFLLGDFGISCAALQYLTENVNNQEKKRLILKYSIQSCFVSSVVTGIIIILSPYFYPYTIDKAKVITPMLFLLPCIGIINGLLSVVLRANFENKKYSKLQIFTTAVTYIILIPFAIIWGLNGAVLSQYVYSIIILIFSVYLTYKYIFDVRNKGTECKLEKNEKKEFIKYALASQLSNSINSILLIIDVFLIGYMISNAEVIATYNVASKLPYALTFISTCVAIYITPHFIKNNKDIEWINKNLKILIKYSALGFGIFCALLIIFSKPIFYILFGTQYYDAIPIYIILIIGLFFNSAFKVPCSNIITTLKKLKVNIYTNLICVCFNFVSNIFFIKIFGIIGAAITTTITNVIVAITYYEYLKHYIKKNRM